MKQTKLEKFVVVTVADARFLPAACCTLISAKQHLPDATNVSLILLAVDVTEQEVAQANAFLLHHHIEHSIKPVSANDLLASGLHVDERATIATYVRLALDKLIDASVEKVLYLDADTRVMVSLMPLFQTDLMDYPYAAAHGLYFYVRDRLIRKNKSLGLPVETNYCNAGVLLFNWQQVLKSGLLSQARDFAAANPEKCHLHDQDALNAVIAGRYLQLDPRWNLVDYYYKNGGKKTAFIKHFTGVKPWKRQRSAVWEDDANWYQALLAGSPWGQFFEQQSWLDRIGNRVRQLKMSLRNLRRVASTYLVPWLTAPAIQNRAKSVVGLKPSEITNISDRWICETSSVENLSNSRMN